MKSFFHPALQPSPYSTTTILGPRSKHQKSFSLEAKDFHFLSLRVHFVASGLKSWAESERHRKKKSVKAKESHKYQFSLFQAFILKAIPSPQLS